MHGCQSTPSCTHLHDVHHALKVGHPHVLPAEVEEPDLGSHEALWVIAEAAFGEVAWAAVVMLTHLLEHTSAFVHASQLNVCQC